MWWSLSGQCVRFGSCGTSGQLFLGKVHLLRLPPCSPGVLEFSRVRGQHPASRPHLYVEPIKHPKTAKGWQCCSCFAEGTLVERNCSHLLLPCLHVSGPVRKKKKKRNRGERFSSIIVAVQRALNSLSLSNYYILLFLLSTVCVMLVFNSLPQ